MSVELVLVARFDAMGALAVVAGAQGESGRLGTVGFGVSPRCGWLS